MNSKSLCARTGLSMYCHTTTVLFDEIKAPAKRQFVPGLVYQNMLVYCKSVCARTGLSMYCHTTTVLFDEFKAPAKRQIARTGLSEYVSILQNQFVPGLVCQCIIIPQQSTPGLFVNFRK